jgi:hypothetical protein
LISRRRRGFTFPSTSRLATAARNGFPGLPQRANPSRPSPSLFRPPPFDNDALDDAPPPAVQKRWCGKTHQVSNTESPLPHSLFSNPRPAAVALRHLCSSATPPDGYPRRGSRGRCERVSTCALGIRVDDGGGAKCEHGSGGSTRRVEGGFARGRGR